MANKTQIFITSTGEILIKEKNVVWIYDSFGNGPLLASPDCLHGQELILLFEKNREQWNRHKYNMKRLWQNRRF
jgi:hypothetical protein